jgi:predicted PurR-regulated permease PerM
MNDWSMQKSMFVLLLAAGTIAFLWLIRGFMQPIFWAAALAILFYPMYGRLVRLMRGRSSAASATSVFIIVLIVIMPLAAVVAAIAAEATALYQRFSDREIDVESWYETATAYLPQLSGWLDAIGIDIEDIQSQLSAAAVATSSFVASRAIAFGQDAVRFTILMFMMLYLLFFFLRDGPKMLEGLIRALPLGQQREHVLLERFTEVSRATIKGTLIVGIVQGTLGGLAFWALGLGAPVLWGVVMGLLSIVPAVGPALVWIPAAIYLIATGSWIAGVILIIFGAIVIGLADNVLRPMLVGRDTRLPDYLILLSTLGGLAAFGLAGIVIGPIIAALFLTLWQMAQEEFSASETTTVADSATQQPDSG